MITHSYKKGETEVQLVWRPIFDPSEVSPIVQVYGLCVTKDGKICIIRNPLADSNFTPWYLPGGTPESDETPEETLQREVAEEADIEISHLKLFGAQEVNYPNNPNKEKGDRYYQLRYFALIDKISQPTIDPHDNKMVERKFIDLDEFTDYIEWGDIGEELYKLAKQEFQKL